MKIHNDPQGSLAWFTHRAGKVTASELKNLLTPELKARTGETPKTYLYSKLAEVWRGKPTFSAGSWATEQGQVREDIAIPFLALERGWDIREAGFIETDDGKAGCSPDGLVYAGEKPLFGVEVKCPEPPAHVRYLMEGTLPKEYFCQVHASLFVTGLPTWTFMSYHADFPPLILTIERDEEICAKIGEAVDLFQEQLTEAKAKIEGYL